MLPLVTSEDVESRSSPEERFNPLRSGRETDRVIRELSEKLSRMAHQFRFLRFDRLAKDLTTISRELREVAVPSPTGEDARHEEQKG